MLITRHRMHGSATGVLYELFPAGLLTSGCCVRLPCWACSNIGGVGWPWKTWVTALKVRLLPSK